MSERTLGVGKMGSAGWDFGFWSDWHLLVASKLFSKRYLFRDCLKSMKVVKSLTSGED